jgi:hypothetical protein
MTAMDAPETLEHDAIGEKITADPSSDPAIAGGEALDEEDEADALPVLELDVHHMQVRALNYWAGLLEEGGIPSIESLSPESDPDLGPYSVLLDFTRGIEDPAITYLGQKLAEQWSVDRRIPSLEGVPEGSFLWRLVDLGVPVLQSRAPRDFKADDAHEDAEPAGYRGILLPFCSGGDAVDFIYAVVNWDAPQPEQAPADILLLDQEAPEGDMPSIVADPAPRANEAIPSADPAAFMLAPRSRAPAGADVHIHRVALAEWLAEARQFADVAVRGEERSRKSLYHAISHAYDFSIEASGRPDDFANLVREAGIRVQSRAPMTAVAKLVFGSDYDKTRLTEFATALGHAHRIGVRRGTFGAFLERTEGGLKGIVAAERRLRREERGESVRPADRPRPELAARLRRLVPLAIADLAPQGDEFTLVMAHRLPDGGVVILGEVPRDIGLIERAARKLIGKPA